MVSETGFGLSEEHELIRASIRELMAGECPRETARELDQAGAFPRELLAKLAELGFCGLCVPEEHGGAGRSLLGAAIVIEETAASSPILAGGFAGIAILGGEVIARLGSREQQERLLPQIARGAAVFSHALGATAIAATRASGDGFLLSGSEPLIPLSAQADYLLTLARADGDGGPGSSVFVVPADGPGIRRQAAATVGWRGGGPGRVTFERARVVAEDVLGGPRRLGEGARQARLVRAVDRLVVAAAAVGIAQGTLDYAAGYAGQRVQFGRPIAEFEAIQQKFAEVAVATRAARLLVYEACWRADEGQTFELEAAGATAQATTAARRASLEAIQILGGQGYMLESDAQRYLRDSLVLFSGAERAAELKCRIGAALGVGREPEWSTGEPAEGLPR